MKTRSTNLLVGTFLIIIGVLFLASSLGRLRMEEEYVWAVLFFASGFVLVLGHFLFDKKLWTLIVGGVGLFIGSAIFIDASRLLPNDSIGVLFFVLTGLVFLTALRGGKKNWWAIIPGGFCFIMAAHVLMEMNWWIRDDYHGVVFFGGAGIVFGILYLLKDDTYRLDWAKYPSIIAFVIAGIVMLAADFRDIFSRFIFPVILVLLGSYIVYTATHRPGLEASDTKPSKTRDGKSKKK